MTDLIEDFGNQEIQINNDVTNKNNMEKNDIQEKPVEIKESKNENHLEMLQEKIEDKAAKEISSQVKSSMEKTWVDKILCCFDFFQQYFQIDTDDFYKRLLNSFIPFNGKFKGIIEQNPDLYGPTWIYTSLILLLAAAGSLTCSIQGNNTKNFFNDFIPIATLIIYGIGFGAPALMALLMKIFGNEIKFVTIICTYGYSYSVYLPVVVACAAPWEILQWILLGYAFISSSSILAINYYKNLAGLAKGKKIAIIIICLIFQIGILLLFKLYFFKKFTLNIHGDNSSENPNTDVQNSTNNTTAKK